MTFNRRDFIKLSGLAAASMFIPKFIKATGNEIELLSPGSKVFVVIQLSGGNDGLNTIIPFNDDLYYKNRPKISIKKSEVIKLNSELGFNPSMKDLKDVFDDGYLTVVNNVGYPNPDHSHFRSMDIWQTASSSNEFLNTGWIGRYLDAECKDCENSFRAIEADETLSLVMKGENKTGMAFQDAEKLYAMANKKIYQDFEKLTKHGKQNGSLDYLYKTLAEATSNAKLIYEKSKIYKSKLTYPATQVAKNLKMISELIVSGLETKVYYTSFSGFDTHANQNNRQSDLLKQYSEAVKAFLKDLKQNNRIDDVVVLTFSEFGRRVAENASGGTDHGTANNVFVAGGKLRKPGIFNEQADLKNLDSGDLKFEIDFRSIYQDVLGRWLNINAKSILGKSFDKVSVV
jgi:uncharacterized protein (DUF1501 family)